MDTPDMVIAKWDDSKKKPVVAKGIIPIPPNWQRALQFDFADFTGDVTQPGQPDKWVFPKQGADLTQSFPDFAYPLTDAQLTKLRVPVEKLPIAHLNSLSCFCMKQIEQYCGRRGLCERPRASSARPDEEDHDGRGGGAVSPVRG